MQDGDGNKIDPLMNPHEVEMDWKVYGEAEGFRFFIGVDFLSKTYYAMSNPPTFAFQPGNFKDITTQLDTAMTMYRAYKQSQKVENEAKANT